MSSSMNKISERINEKDIMVELAKKIHLLLLLYNKREFSIVAKHVMFKLVQLTKLIRSSKMKIPFH